ncbi:MAG: lysoplasmalogenase [Dechloromonas sp.]|uniref:Lysoplasmalogenase n=1 Tax=Candidatus Dechloromonas phosphorivorans TaxID=2899244 RepID=A0A9D7LJJ3_9RHOO|nr:lysoplasmalogenase [Candidatus Dechloromonas phosphorivorans]
MNALGPIVLCAVAVAGLLVAEYRESRRGLWLAKPVASAAFIWLGLASGAPGSGYGGWVLVALLLCWLGDVLLIPRDRPRVFKAGVFAFLLGHVAYSAAFLTRPLDPYGLAAGAVIVGVVILTVLRWLGKSLPPDMVGPVRTYMLVIGVMSALACGVTAAGGPWAVAVGALAFMASDISVARDRFVRHQFINRAWGLPLYYAAQLLLAKTSAVL